MKNSRNTKKIVYIAIASPYRWQGESSLPPPRRPCNLHTLDGKILERSKFTLSF